MTEKISDMSNIKDRLNEIEKVQDELEKLIKIKDKLLDEESLGINFIFWELPFIGCGRWKEQIHLEPEFNNECINLLKLILPKMIDKKKEEYNQMKKRFNEHYELKTY